MTRKLGLAPALGLALSLALVAACSSTGTPESEDSSTPAAETTTEETVEPAQGVTDTTITIANSAATSGAYAPVGVPFLAGLQAYLDMVNAEGGVDGRTIEFKHVDDEFDPAKGAAALTEFVEDEKVFAIVGHFGTPVVAATVDQLKEYGIPAVYFATGIGQLYAEGATTNADGYNIFPVQPIYRTEGGIMAAFASSKFKAEKVGIIYTNDDAGMDLEKGAKAQLEVLGVDYVEEQVAAGAADVSAAVTSIKNADVDFIIVASIQGTMPTIVKELAAQGVDKDGITTYVNVAKAMSDAVAADISGKFDLYGLGWVDYTSDTAKVSLAEYQAHIDAEYAANAYAQTGWIAGTFFVEGLKRLNGAVPTWDAYMKALESAPIQNPFGGQIDFAGGARLGTQEMNLSKVVPADDANPAGWVAVEGLQSVDALINQ